ncbi:MAG: serine/threonine protein kinase [Proteobacteria bacterium]|jgi:serine/threonine protein kinase|nr:serine/threonine protein kinase [Pseudomonadota bacterium]
MSYKPGDVLKERYVIQEVLGQGSMGEVYRAEHVTIHRQFAIKLMHVHVAEQADALTRFMREARAAAQLEHPHICQVTDFDSTASGDFYLVMEYLKGETLRDRLKRDGCIELHSIFRIMDDLLCALECAHESGIVHRDVKPENISLIPRDNRDDYVKLIDFGIAHAEKPSDNNGTLTQAGQVYGTPQYLSPEQVMGNPVDLRADLYSCGCTLYEMIEGVPPFNAENYILLLNKHLVLDPPHLTRPIECSEALDEVIQKLLKKHPEERYGSAREVRIALSEIAHRFDPTLNLYMSQHGAASPSISNAPTTPAVQNSQNGLVVNSSNGISSISNPYLNPEEVCLLQSAGNQTASSIPNIQPSVPTNSEHHAPPADQASKKIWLIIGIASGIIAILSTTFLLFYMSLKHKEDMIAPKPAQTQVIEVVEAPIQEVEEPPKHQQEIPEVTHEHPMLEIYDMEEISELNPDGYIISDEQIRAFAQTECIITEDDPLYQDQSLNDAIKNCAQGNFEEAYKVFVKSKNKYILNGRFFMMSLIISYATRRYRDAIRDALQLITNEPAAVCTPAVKEIIYSLYEDDIAYGCLRTGLFNLFNQHGSSEALSWLLLMTPCNKHQKRFERLSDSIKVATRSFEEEYNETWLGVAVHLWDKFDPKSKCSVKKTVDKIIYTELNTSCHAEDSDVANTAICTMCYPVWKKRYTKSK